MCVFVCVFVFFFCVFIVLFAHTQQPQLSAFTQTLNFDKRCPRHIVALRGLTVSFLYLLETGADLRVLRLHTVKSEKPLR